MTATAATDPLNVIGVGIDTARYGHHVSFLRPDLQPACKPLSVPETRQGYDQLAQQFRLLQQRFPNAHFHVRLDAAGQYAANLEAFLRQLPFPLTLSVGQPASNARYRQVFSPKRKADPVDSYSAARFAVVERPPAAAAVPDNCRNLMETARRLEGQTRHSTRLTNQLHNLLARVFPELALLAQDLAAGWVLHLLSKYPTPEQLARAHLSSLTALPHVSADKAQAVQQAARTSVASLTGPTAQQLVRTLVDQLRQSLAAEEQLKDLLGAAYQALPQPNHLTSIPGIGVATAAVLTAKMVSIDRFATAADVVGYFGIFAEDDSSGVERDGQPKPGRQQHMSRQGNDLVRKYLWNAAKSASQHNPAVRALYRRLTGRGRRGDVALGHCMRKLLHLVFAVWKTGRPFDPEHYPWEPPPPLADGGGQETAGHSQGTSPAGKVVTAASPTVGPAQPGVKGAATTGSPQASGGLDGGPAQPGVTGAATATPAASVVDFGWLRGQVSMEQVLAQLGQLQRLRGSGPQRRGPCPIHAGAGQGGRTFSVHLDKGIFQCFHPPCAAHGNVLDLWAAVKQLPLHEAALDLARTFGIALPPLEEQRRGTR